MSSVLNRRKLEQTCDYFCTRIMCCGSKLTRFNKLYIQGERRLNKKDLDLYQIAKSARRTKVMSKSLLNPTQQLLLRLQKNEML